MEVWFFQSTLPSVRSKKQGLRRKSEAQSKRVRVRSCKRPIPALLFGSKVPRVTLLLDRIPFSSQPDKWLSSALLESVLGKQSRLLEPLEHRLWCSGFGLEETKKPCEASRNHTHSCAKTCQECLCAKRGAAELPRT